MTLDERLIEVVPSARQLELMDMEFYAFVHFTVNTFTDKEWGDGTEDESVFNPTAFNADQWVEAVKSAGMKGLILTCKHHDGFCLWPSAYTKHSVASSPFRGGKGDIVKEVAEACKKGGIALGVYLSPWDRNQPLYGTGKAYDDYFVGQLTELLTNYGPIFSVWFDGACGEGPNGKKQYYDWDRYYKTIRELQPNACINVCGPDIRWCGNEAGDTREAEWSVVPARTRDTEKIASLSQQADNDEFSQRKIRAQDRDLGSRTVLQDETDLVWYPAEVNTSIRRGWFWHASQDDAVKPLEKLVDIYEKSVGGNATMLLNIPPTNEGLFHANDVKRLKEIGDYIRTTYSNNLIADSALVTAPEAALGSDAGNMLTSEDTAYEPKENGPITITVEWPEEKTFDRVVLMEDVTRSQRVEHYAIDAMINGAWQTLHEGSVIGHKRIAILGSTRAAKLRIRITDVRVKPILKFIAVY